MGSDITLPNERYRSVKYAREFLIDLLDPSKTPKVPKDIRRRAAACLRHFPGEYDMSIVAKKVPNFFFDEERDEE